MKGGLGMEWDIDKNRPICPQICEQLCIKIANGELQPNTRLLSVRETAVAAGVNPNTVQKSFGELERLGLVYSVRGTGWFVSENTEAAKETVKNIIQKKTGEYFKEMGKLGFTTDEVKNYIKEWNI